MTEELIERRRARLSPAAQQILTDMEEAAASPDGMRRLEEIGAKILNLHPREQDEMIGLIGAKIVGDEAALRANRRGRDRANAGLRAREADRRGGGS